MVTDVRDIQQNEHNETALAKKAVLLGKTTGNAYVEVQVDTAGKLVTSGGGGFTNPMTTLGDMIYENSTPTADRLAGNTTTTKKFLHSLGAGGAATAPSWEQVAYADVSGTPVLTAYLLATGATTGATSQAQAFTNGIIYGNNSPTANYTLTQNSVVPFTSVGSGAVVNTLYLKEGNVGIGTTNPTNILSLGNTSAQKIWIENSASDVAGKSLTVAAGGTVQGGAVAHVAGGNLILQSGLGTSLGGNSILFQTGTPTSGTVTLQTMSTKMSINGAGTVDVSGIMNLIGLPSLTSGNLFVGDYTAGSSAGLGGNIVFGGDTINQPAFQVPFANIRGIKENSTNENSLGALVFGTQSNSGRLQNLTTVTEKMRITSGGNVGIGTTSPSAVLQIKAGTATAGTAPIKLTAGTLNTTPESGTIEFDGGNFYLNI